MIIPKPQTKDGIDIITNNLLGDAVESIPIKNPGLLADSMLKLIFSKKDREKKLKLLELKKKNFLKSWDERIQLEIGLLDQLIESINEK